MKKLRNIMAIAAVAFMASCTVGGPILVTDNECREKRGVAGYTVWLGFIKPTDADASIKKACENGKITKVGTVDMKVKSGFIKKTVTTVVTGS